MYKLQTFIHSPLNWRTRKSSHIKGVYKAAYPINESFRELLFHKGSLACVVPLGDIILTKVI